MTAKNLTTVSNELITSYGNTAKNVIAAYRVGNERAVGYVDQSWATAVEKVGTRVPFEVRSNALAAQKKISALYVQGVVLTSDGADVAVNRAIALANKGVEQVAANATRFEKAVGASTFNTLTEVALPAAQAVGKVATKLEEQSGVLVNKIAGSKAKVKVATVKRTVSKKAAPKATPKAAAKPVAKAEVKKTVAPAAKAAAPAVAKTSKRASKAKPAAVEAATAVAA